MEYDFTMPFCGKKLRWRPLRVEEVLSEKAALKSMDANTVVARLYVRRITWYDGKEGSPSDYMQWDDDDLTLFVEEVDQKEGERRAAFRKSQIKDSDLLAGLQRALADLNDSLRQVGTHATLALESARLMERNQDPSKSGQT